MFKPPLLLASQTKIASLWTLQTLQENPFPLVRPPSISILKFRTLFNSDAFIPLDFAEKEHLYQISTMAKSNHS